MRKVFIVFTIILSIFYLSSCLKHIDDTNGDEKYTLEHITDEKIVKGMNTITMKSCNTYVNGKGTVSIKKLSGVETVAKITSRKSTISIKVTSTVNSGNLKIVVTDGEKIVLDIPVNESCEYEITNVKDNYFLKVAGESANFKLSYEISGEVDYEDIN